MSNKIPALAVVVVGLVLAGSGAWYLQSGRVDAQDPAVDENDHLRGVAGPAGPASGEASPSEGVAERTAMPDAGKVPGSLRVEVVLKGSGTPASGVSFHLLRRGGGGAPAVA